MYFCSIQTKWLAADIEMAEKNSRESSTPEEDTLTTNKGMVLPFTPLSLAFDHVNYYINMPTVSSTYSSQNLIISNSHSLQHCFSSLSFPICDKYLC